MPHDSKPTQNLGLLWGVEGTIPEPATFASLNIDIAGNKTRSLSGYAAPLQRGLPLLLPMTSCTIVPSSGSTVRPKAFDHALKRKKSGGPKAPALCSVFGARHMDLIRR